MLSSPNSKLAMLALAATMVTTTQAHSNMILPLPTWNSTFYGRNSPSATIDADTALTVPSGQSFYTSPSANTIAFTEAFDASKYTSLRELVYATEVLSTDATAECGFSYLGTKEDLPEYVEWNTLTASHEGPCEVWCDDVRVFADTDCAANFTTTPALLPYDRTKCKGASVLQSIWLALHSPPWQVYTNCAALTGDYSSSVSGSTDYSYGVSDSGSSTSATTTTTTTTASSTASSGASAASTTTASSTADEASIATSAQASASSATSSTTTATTTAPETTTATPTTTTATPTTTTATTTETSSDGSFKCNVRSRRRRN